MLKAYWAAGTWLIALLLMAASASAQVDAAAQLDTSRLTIGDQTQLRLIISYAPAATALEIDAAALDSLKGVEVLHTKQGTPYGTGPRQLVEHIYTITSFDAGSYRIPRLYVSYTQGGQQYRVSTQELPLTVSTLAVEQDSVQLQPIKDILAEGYRWQDALPWLALAASLAALAWLLVRLWRRRQPKEAAPVPVVIRPAHEIALERLQALEAAQLWQAGQSKAYQSELTFILREYLENRYQISALELTSDEILQALKPINLATAWQAELRAIFQTADLVKFAKAEPPQDVHPRALQQALRFIDATRLPDEDGAAAEPSPQHES